MASSKHLLASDRAVKLVGNRLRIELAGPARVKLGLVFATRAIAKTYGGFIKRALLATESDLMYNHVAITMVNQVKARIQELRGEQ